MTTSIAESNKDGKKPSRPKNKKSQMTRSRSKRRKFKATPERPSYFISPEDKQQIYQMYMAGAKPLEIAKHLCISDKTVYKYLKEMFCPADGWRRGFVSSSEERSIRLAAQNGESLDSVCTKFRRPMWMIWPIIVKPQGIGSFVEVESPEKLFQVTTHEYIERIGTDKVSLGQRVKSFFGRMFSARSD